MFDRPGDRGERAVLVQLTLPSEQNDLLEFEQLAHSAGAIPVATIEGRRTSPTARFFVGKGKLEEIGERIAADRADLVLFNHDLSPSQERNLEAALECRVIDRTGLILDIFSQRAQSFEGKLQVELAQLRHLSTRLIRGWTHLERQKGGIGLRGPGETQLETDRRLLGNRIRQIRSRLEKVDKQRGQSRRARKKADVFTIALVGYTNAGKSTLFNKLTHASLYTADQLFATLDPTIRRYLLPNETHAVLVDTVGFIRNLPHDLVVAFRSTLQEACEADILLHIIDANDSERDQTIRDVNQVLTEIGADQVHQIQVFNKIDLLERHQPRVERNSKGEVDRIWLSAGTSEGIEQLGTVLGEYFQPQRVVLKVNIPAAQGAVRSKLYEFSKVLREDVNDYGDWQLEIEIAKKNLGLLRSIETDI
ncbi:MAG: ribosome rescue GTPase HflX [Methylococcales bacterium]